MGAPLGNKNAAGKHGVSKKYSKNTKMKTLFEQRAAYKIAHPRKPAKGRSLTSALVKKLRGQARY